MTASSPEVHSSIRPGQPWLDTSGNRIQAHGGSIPHEDGTFCWFRPAGQTTIRFGGLPGNGTSIVELWLPPGRVAPALCTVERPWRNRNARDKTLRELVKRANLA